jgi:hypothetical protein
VDVRVKVDGTKSPTIVEYTVQETAGPWNDRGIVEVSQYEKNGGEKPLFLNLPGRGLYKLNLLARSGDAQTEAETWIAIVFTPAKPDPKSPWGIFYCPPFWFDKGNPNIARDVAESHRLLGASWSRLNWWSQSFGTVTITTEDGKTKVTADYSLWKSYAVALRREGISIMGEIAQTPRELSSRPDETAEAGDAGPLYCRSKPRDYTLWDQLIEKLATDFREEIQVWEIWNEPDVENLYWAGAVEDFAELVQHTSQALRRGNPSARIVAAGFTNPSGFVDRLFQLGMGKFIDILSVHYTDHRGSICEWRHLMKKFKLNLPIWNTEETSEVPLRNLASGIERSFKFIHVAIGYPESRPLVRKDLTVLPAGIKFSVGAHCIGTGSFIGVSDKVLGHMVYFFQRGEEVIGVFKRIELSLLLGDPDVGTVTLAIEPVAGQIPSATDVWGRSLPLKIKNGQTTLSLNGTLLFVNGARRLDILNASFAKTKVAILVEAESGRWSTGWNVASKAYFSGSKVLDIHKWFEPGDQGYWVNLTFNVPVTGRYEILFSGNSLSRLKRPRSLSPFVWSIDGGREHPVSTAIPSMTDIEFGDGVSTLGTVDLKQGEHIFRLLLAGRRDIPDKYYALWFDAIVLRLKANNQ